MPNNVNIKTLVDDLGNIVVPITHVNAVFDNEGHTLTLILDKYPIDSKEDEEEGTALSLVTTGEKYIWNSKLSSSEKGANNGIATLDNSGKVPSSQLPSYVDDIIEGYYHGVEDPDTHEITYNFYSDSSYTQLITPETGKIYVDLDTNLTYRWSGSLYIVMSSPYVLPTASTNVLGGIKVGTNLSIDSNGVLSATDTTYENKQAAEGGINESLVTTGEKYIWNNKTSVSKSETIAVTNGVYAIYADGSLKTATEADNNALGVAVITDDCCFVIDKTNNTNVTWDSQYSTNGVIPGCTSLFSNIQSDFAGVSNTTAIVSVASGGEAAKYCRQLTLIVGGVTKQGYLGACGEWYTAYQNKTDVDTMITAIGGTAISTDNVYWSSTLRDNDVAWFLHWNTGDINYATKHNNYSARNVRPLYPITKQELEKTVITPIQTVTIEQSTGNSTTNVMSLNAVSSHILDTDIHVTAAEKEYWNSKVNPPSYSAPTAKNLTYTGEAQDLLNPGSSTSGSIQYSTDEVNWSTTVPQGTNAGAYTVYWRFAGSEVVYVDSTAISVTIAKANPTYTAPTAKTITYNGNAQELLNAGTSNDGTISYSDDNENWGSSIPQGTNADSYTVYWKLTSDANHNDVASTAINVSIAKVTPTVIAPTAKSGLEYNSTAQDLVTAGSTNYGELQYSLNDTNYSTSVPTGTNTGSYTVYYKVVGNSNVNDVATTSISVSIAKGTPTVTAPTAKSLTYNGLAQELVNAGVSNFGTIKYSIGVKQYVVNNNNGHAYVDLGLPSGTLWGTMNVGANAPEDYGNYYQYGKGADQYAATIGQSDYSGAEDPLSLSVDTARQVWNGGWHMPTRAQLNELTANTTYTWETNFNGSGINGGKFTAQNGNYIFIPAAGAWLEGKHSSEGSYGYIWSSSPEDSINVFYLEVNDRNKRVSRFFRKRGFSIRGVIEPSTIIVPSTYSPSIPTGTNAGTYYVYWKIEGDDNINEVSGSTAIEVTISKINSTITMSGNSTNMSVGQTNTLTISVAGGATPTITSSNTSVATVNGYTISAVGGGTTTITISTPTDYNHNGDTVTYTLTAKYMHNGHEYVDLGLPSGTKWAKMNVGATSETEYGNYYQYGKGADQYAATIGQSDYSGMEDPLATSVDTAAQVWGGSWHMPTRTQCQELINNTTYTWTTVNGVFGGRFIASNGNYIFIPAAGDGYGGNIGGLDDYGGVWSSSPTNSEVFELYFDEHNAHMSYDPRKVGHSIRGVVG